ncbi:MAG: VanZ family protein [Microbacteriaceae bacterium]
MLHRHPVLGALTAVYLGVVCWVTLGPQPLDQHSESWLWRALGFFGRHDLTSWITYDRLEFTANMAMFLPVGLFFLLLFGRRLWWLAILLSFALTVGIEFVQLFLPTRVSDVRDILSNTSGAVIGVFLGLVLTARSRGSRARLRPAGTVGTR